MDSRMKLVAACLLLTTLNTWGQEQPITFPKGKIEDTKRIQWIAFLMSRVDSHTRRMGWEKPRPPKWNDIGILLEVCSFGPKDVLAAVDGYRGQYRKLLTPHLGSLEHENIPRMVERVLCNMPHYPVTYVSTVNGEVRSDAYDSQMWPLSIQDGKIVFIGEWSDSQPGGVDLNAFTFFKIHGLRDLGKFSSQRLTASERNALWTEFQAIKFPPAVTK